MPESRVKVIEVEVRSMRPNGWNPNVQSEFMFEKELNSIRKFGFLDPPTVRELEDGIYEIIDGEHRWMAATQLGMTTIPVNNLGSIPKAQAMQLTEILNGLKGKSDTALLSKLLVDISKEVSIEEMTLNLPYTPVEISTMMSDNAAVWNHADAPPMDNNSSQTEEEHGDTKIISLRLPKEVAAEFKAQLERVKRLMFPGDDPAHISPIGPIRAISRVLQSCGDDAFIGSSYDADGEAMP